MKAHSNLPALFIFLLPNNKNGTVQINHQPHVATMSMIQSRM